MVRNLLYVLTFFCLFTLSAQNETTHWHFGEHISLDFSSSPPAVTNSSSIYATDGCASISDAFGNLLFYTNGVTVWNRQHQVMANGTGLSAHLSSFQSALIVRHPLNNGLYYIVTTYTSVNYSIVDMNLAAGMGSVTVKNVLLYANCAEKLTGVRHCNGIDSWIVTHETGTNNFVSHLITQSGISSNSVISNIGPVFTNPTGRVGQMKISPSGKRLGMAYNVTNMAHGGFSLFDFDNSTGIVSNYTDLGSIPLLGALGCEFSSAETKFYVSSLNGPTGNIFQWDLCNSTSSTVIAASRYTLSLPPLTKPASMQLASDGKIYIARHNLFWLGVISNPEAQGANCGFNSQYISLAPDTCFDGLPNFVTSLIKPPFSYAQDLGCGSASFSVPASLSSTIFGCTNVSNVVNSIVWNFGDPSSGTANLSSSASPTHHFSSPGTYTVKLIYQINGCAPDSIVQKISITPASLTVNTASATCNGAATASAAIVQPHGTGPYSYSWAPSGTTGSVASNLSPGQHTVTVSEAGGTCSATFTTNITAPLQITANITSSLACSSATAEISMVHGSGSYSYSWMPGNSTGASLVTQTATQNTISVYDNIHQCTVTKTIAVVPLAPPSLSVSGRTNLCKGETSTITVNGGNRYNWSNGDTTSYIVVTPVSNLSYSVTASADTNSCVSTKTVSIKITDCTSIQKNETGNAPFIYPNPGDKKFTVMNEQPFKLQIVNVSGQLVFERSFSGGKHTFGTTELNAGVYLFVLSDENGKRTGKLIIGNSGN